MFRGGGFGGSARARETVKLERRTMNVEARGGGFAGVFGKAGRGPGSVHVHGGVTFAAVVERCTRPFRECARARVFCGETEMKNVE